MNLIWIAALATAGCRLLTNRWPWEFLRPQSTRQQALFRARQLLGLREQASRTEIIEAHRLLLSMVHPDRGGTNSQVHEANDARDLLIDELPDGR